jgi:hypothetical protein
MSDRKKDMFLSEIAKDIVKEKISGYVKNVKEEIKPTVDELIELTKQLVPDSYEEVIESFYESNTTNSYYDDDNTYEVVKVIEAWDLNFLLGNSIKHISRAGKNNPKEEKEDLLKAVWYLNRRIKKIEKESKWK